jgi:D-alanine transaminase
LELLFVEEFPDHGAELRRQGVRVCTCPDIRWERCDIKSTNLLGNVLAAQTAKEMGAYEALFYLQDGTITEGARTNLIGVRNGRLLTAPTTPQILPGITRDFIIQLARDLSVPVEEQAFKLDHLSAMSELFLTGTTSEVMPIAQVDEQQIGDGRPGPITRRFQEAYRAAVRQVAG